MAAVGLCVTFSGIHCTLPGCRLADVYEDYITKAHNISVLGMVDSFLQSHCQGCHIYYRVLFMFVFFLPFQFCLILIVTGLCVVARTVAQNISLILHFLKMLDGILIKILTPISYVLHKFIKQFNRIFGSIFTLCSCYLPISFLTNAENPLRKVN